MMEGSALEAVLKRDRVLVLAGLAATAGLAWIYVLALAARMGGGDAAMPDMPEMSSTLGLHPWGLVDGTLVFLMWAVMMVAMMLPSASPMVLIYAALARQQAGGARPLGSTALFVGGYLLVWATFSLAATLAQWGLESAALLSPMMTSASPQLGGAVLVAAGVYQLSPLKQVCLRHCRSPLQFLLQHWRLGPAGGFGMGVRHGAWCVGCCWVLMALLFVGGVMNPLWIAAIAVFVLAEKAAPFGAALGKVSGIALAAAGLAVLLHT